MAQVTVGTPPQKQNLVIDTGSSDVWMLSSQAVVCADRRYIAYYGGCSSVCKTSLRIELEYQILTGFAES